MKYNVALANEKNNEVLVSGVRDTDDKLELDNRKSFKLKREYMLYKNENEENFYNALFNKLDEIVIMKSNTLSGKFKVGLSSCGNVTLTEID